MWDEDTGLLRNRGPFHAVVSSLPGIKAAGAKAVYFMGAREQPHHVHGESSKAGEVMAGCTALELVRRDASAAVLCAVVFKGPLLQARGLGLTPAVDAIEQVAC